MPGCKPPGAAPEFAPVRIDSEQLPQHLGRGLKPLYTIVGEEMLLALEAADRIRAKSLEAGHDERRVLTAEPGFDWGELDMLGNSLSLFAPKRVIDLRIPGGKPGKDGSEALQKLAARLPEDTSSSSRCPDWTARPSNPNGSKRWMRRA
jgi:DNA polymerase-3 subunit delta